MAREVKRPKEELAPAYFVQYSALWCIMLGFFVLLLSLGNTQTGAGDNGVGAVRDAFGLSGGLGMMPFSKNAFRSSNDVSSSLRIVRTEDSSTYAMDGYIRSMLSKRGLSDLALWMIEDIPGSPKVLIGLPVKFRDDMHLDPKSVRMLEVLSEVIFHLSGHQFDCMMHLDGESGTFASQKKAMLRSAVVARFIAEASSLPPDTIRAVGYYDNRYLSAYGIENVSGKVLLSIQKSRPTGRSKSAE